MGTAVLSELGTEILVPVCAVVGIVFSLIQWYLVSRVKLTAERQAPGSSPAGANKNGYNDYLIEEEEGLNDHSVVAKCADIQTAISEGMKIATYANARTTLEARKGVGKAFITAFRVGGGIYTKAADVGADLVGKVERNIPEDDPRNPAVIADNVGDNVGDIAGMGSVGILVCLITTLFATDFFEIKAVKEIEPALKKQLIISTVLMTVGIAIVTWIGLPSSFTIFNFGTQKVVKNWQLFLCVAVGLWLDLSFGFVTEYYTSNAYSPVQDVADSCRTGAATNVIFGLALGYKSVIIPILP
ncbi:hypothetical protein GH714_033684 [Hevea brasiliensis]|uniref:H(+)-exporting diphosphatase n=1 Tax=Hevea brasiliensis TaxID=3981 RepID=A0A6A6NAC5_HEVBR|nr:hypothetical protein GH714_033684 [Hevea brasiliensis]